MKSSPSSVPASLRPKKDLGRVPKLADLTSRTFRDRFTGLLTAQREVFGDGRSRIGTATFPDHASFARALEQDTDFAGNFAREAGTMLLEESIDDLRVAQQVQLFELMQAPLLQEPGYLSTVLFPSGAGTGKTRVAGRIPEIARRMTGRGVYDKSTMVLVRRRGMIAPQTFTTEERGQMLLHSTESANRQKLSKLYLSQWLGLSGIYHDSEDLIQVLLSLREAGSVTLSKLQQVFQSAEMYDELLRVPNHASLFSDLLKYLNGQAVPVRATSENETELLHFSETQEFTEGGGDLFLSLPDEYKHGPHVHVHTAVGDVRKADHSSLPTADTLLGVFSRTSLLQSGSQRKVAEFLKNVGIIILDEAEGVSPYEMGGWVTRAGGEEPNLVFASTASEKRKRPPFGKKLSFLAPETAMNMRVDGTRVPNKAKSAETILQPMRLVRVESKDNILYPSASYEAVDQLLEFYGKTLGLPKKLGIPQPTEGHHMVVVDSHLVMYASHILRGLTTGSDVQVRLLLSNSDEELNLLLQQVMSDPNARPTCIVSGPNAVKDSFDWRQLNATWLGVHDSNNGEGVDRLAGRQSHTARKTSYLVYQQFSNESSRNFLPHTCFQNDAGFPRDGTFGLTQGQVFLGAHAVRQEKLLVAKEKDPVTATARMTPDEYRKQFVLRPGTFAPSISDQALSTQTSTIVFPKVGERGVFADGYTAVFAKANLLPEDVFLEKLGSQLTGCSTPEQALIVLERTAHFTRAASIRRPQSTYK